MNRQRLQVLILGWKRRSAMLLNEAGCPRWLIRWRCPVPVGWSDLYRTMRGLAPWLEYHVAEWTRAIEDGMKAIAKIQTVKESDA